MIGKFGVGVVEHFWTLGLQVAVGVTAGAVGDGVEAVGDGMGVGVDPVAGVGVGVEPAACTDTLDAPVAVSNVVISAKQAVAARMALFTFAIT